MTTEKLFLTNRGKLITWHKIRANLGGVSFETAYSSVKHFKKLQPNIKITVNTQKGVRISPECDANQMMSGGYSDRPNAYGSVFNR